MNKRDVIMGVIFGLAGLAICWYLSDMVPRAARGAADDVDPGRSLVLVVLIGFAVLALANGAAMRARARRRSFEDRD